MRLLGPLALFAFGLLLRLLFQAATPDGGVGWHVGFQGDAPAWQDLAARLAQGVPDVELTLPLRPPGMIQGLAWLWNGEGATVGPVRLLFVVLGAAVAPLLWLLLRPLAPAPVAWLAALLCAASTNLLLLSSGLHVETPYLAGTLLALLAQRGLAGERPALAAIGCGLLHGLLCLLRAEHLVVAVALAAVALATGVRWRALLLAALAMAAPIAPWQWHVHRQVALANGGAPPLPPTAVVWQDDALAALRALPGFAQLRVHRFVTATQEVRGRDRVTAADLAIVREAFGCTPEPLRPSFVALQGAFSFWLACTPESQGGHSRLCLDRPPPLLGGPERYPPGARDDRPRGGAFRLDYPPHLDVFVHGYARGFAELAADPAGALRRLWQKACYAAAGLTGGLGGAALPIGLSGERPAVDMVLATGGWATAWRALVLAVALAGLWRLRAVRGLWPLFAFAAVRLLLVAAFFGHARHGALALPVVALGVAAAAHALAVRTGRARWLPWIAAGLAALLLAVELWRARGVDVRFDGRPFTQAPAGVADHGPHTITFR